MGVGASRYYAPDNEDAIKKRYVQASQAAQHHLRLKNHETAKVYLNIVRHESELLQRVKADAERAKPANLHKPANAPTPKKKNSTIPNTRKIRKPGKPGKPGKTRKTRKHHRPVVKHRHVRKRV